MGLFKRGNTWWFKKEIGGRRVQESTGTTNKKSAELYYSKRIQELEDDQRNGPKPVVVEHTFEEFQIRYMETHSRRNKEESSSIRDKWSFKQLEKSFNGLMLREITPERISEYKDRRMAEGVMVATLAKELQLLRNALNIAVREWKWLEMTPFLEVKIEVPNNEIERFLTPDEEARLLKECPDWLKEIVIFAINTGMRRNEILTLKWPQVDLDRRVLTLLVTKNKDKRGVPMNATVQELLRAKGAIRTSSGYVFPSEAGTQINPHNLERAFRAARKEAKLEDVRFHDLRHTAGSRMAQAGIDIYTIAKILGHRTLAMTMRYAHHNVESLRHGLDALVAKVACSENPGTVALQSNEKTALETGLLEKAG